MFDADSLHEISTGPAPAALPAMQRARGIARVSFKHGTKTSLDDLYQSGCAKVRLPKVYDAPPVAVIINTAGGITGGDRLSYEASVAPGGHAIATTQTAERAYRRVAGHGQVNTKLSAGDGATLEWLPQEAILFNASALHRSMQVDLEGSARLIAVESVVIGRTAMEEAMETVEFQDRWRIRRDGRLIFADDARIKGTPAGILKGKAALTGGMAFATFVDCAEDAEDRIKLARTSLEAFGPGANTRAAASAWNGVLTARFAAPDGRSLRSALIQFLETYRSAALPRVWSC
ncbi:urease accessory protein UreD [Roseibium litorale]|uniref:Urease accessory protein UreD n=1 Tax=Roseibium litorale TaxID=2803841 RepID=A0ABR9CLP4_9HYPH|nr:urease accessory protein UreD [Roseibium litorale]MBD8891663.1 urease accessory protein UreD [Roseibium litorale]